MGLYGIQCQINKKLVILYRFNNRNYSEFLRYKKGKFKCRRAYKPGSVSANAVMIIPLVALLLILSSDAPEQR